MSAPEAAVVDDDPIVQTRRNARGAPPLATTGVASVLADRHGRGHAAAGA
jgi:hypothetical protein